MRSELQEKQFTRQNTDEFKEKYGLRYIIEAKNSELKHSYHLDKAISYGLDAYTLQGAVALLTSYLVRINRILDEKAKQRRRKTAFFIDLPLENRVFQ